MFRHQPVRNYFRSRKQLQTTQQTNRNVNNIAKLGNIIEVEDLNALNEYVNSNLGAKEYQVTHKANAIFLSCIDFRFIDDTIHLLEGEEQCKCFDSFCLAGCCLGSNTFTKWRDVFKEHVTIAESLHHIDKIIFIEHMDCGAYKLIYGEITRDEEVSLHIKNVREAYQKFRVIYPNLQFVAYLIDVNSSWQKISL
jgi:carbonic anhydrase